MSDLHSVPSPLIRFFSSKEQNAVHSWKAESVRDQRAHSQTTLTSAARRRGRQAEALVGVPYAGKRGSHFAHTVVLAMSAYNTEQLQNRLSASGGGSGAPCNSPTPPGPCCRRGRPRTGTGLPREADPAASAAAHSGRLALQAQDRQACLAAAARCLPVWQSVRLYGQTMLRYRF